jgi:hypothetical protein
LDSGYYGVGVAKLAKKKLPAIGDLMAWWHRHLKKCTLRQASPVVAITDDFVPVLRQFGVLQEKTLVIRNASVTAGKQTRRDCLFFSLAVCILYDIRTACRAPNRSIQPYTGISSANWKNSGLPSKAPWRKSASPVSAPIVLLALGAANTGLSSSP